MPLTVTITRGTTLTADRPLTVDDLNALGTPSVSLAGAVGSADLDDGAVQARHVMPDRILVGTATGSNQQIVTLFPGPAAHESGIWFWLVPGSTNTGPVTLIINALDERPLRRPDGSECRAGDLVAGQPALVGYDATAAAYVLLNPGLPGMVSLEDVGTANAMSVSLPRVLPDLSGLRSVLLRVTKAAEDNTGPVTLKVNDGANVAVTRADGSVLGAGELRGGSELLLVHDGTQYRVLAGNRPRRFGGTLTPGATVPVPIADGEFFQLNTGTVGGTLTLSPTGTPETGRSLVVEVTYGTGTNPVIAGPAGTLWAGGSTPGVGTSGRVDLVSLLWNGTVWLGMYRTNFT